MTDDIRTAAQRECVNCGKAYVPTSDTQKFCESMCKRENYMKRRCGKEYAEEWRRNKERRHVRIAARDNAPAPTLAQIESAIRGRTATAGAKAVLALMQGQAEGES